MVHADHEPGGQGGKKWLTLSYQRRERTKDTKIQFGQRIGNWRGYAASAMCGWRTRASIEVSGPNEKTDNGFTRCPEEKINCKYLL